MGLLETGEDKLQQSRTLQAGTLVIGASDTVTSQFLLPHLDAFHRRYPNIHIRIISGRSYKVLGLSAPEGSISPLRAPPAMRTT